MKTPPRKFNPAAPDRVSDGEWAKLYGVNRGTANGWRRKGAPLDDPESLAAWLMLQRHPPERLALEIFNRSEEIMGEIYQSPAGEWSLECFYQKIVTDAVRDLEDLAGELPDWRGEAPEVGRLWEAIEALRETLRGAGWAGPPC